MIRPAKMSDIEAIYGLIRQLSGYDFSRIHFDDCYTYNVENGCVLVYERDGTIYGCAVFAIHYHLHFSRKTAEIVNLIVDKNLRGSGIGKKLLVAIEQITHDSGCVCIEVASQKHREDAHRFYEREGFVCGHYKLRKELVL